MNNGPMNNGPINNGPINNGPMNNGPPSSNLPMVPTKMPVSVERRKNSIDQARKYSDPSLSNGLQNNSGLGDDGW